MLSLKKKLQMQTELIPQKAMLEREKLRCSNGCIICCNRNAS